jgi:hypothetical protein
MGVGFVPLKRCFVGLGYPRFAGSAEVLVRRGWLLQVGAASGCAGRRRGFGSAVGASADCPAVLRCLARAELAALTAFALLRQAARVSLRSALTRAARHPARFGAPQAPRRLPAHPDSDTFADRTPFTLSLSKGLRHINPTPFALSLSKGTRHTTSTPFALSPSKGPRRTDHNRSP